MCAVCVCDVRRRVTETVFRGLRACEDGLETNSGRETFATWPRFRYDVIGKRVRVISKR